MSDIITQLKALKLYGMAAYYADLQNNGTPGATARLDSSVGILHQLLQADQLATLEFTETARNLVLVGGTGTGKTHLAIAIGISGIQYHNKNSLLFHCRSGQQAGTGEKQRQTGKIDAQPRADRLGHPG